MFEEDTRRKRSLENGDSDSETEKKQRRSGGGSHQAARMSDGGRSPRSDDGRGGGGRGRNKNDQDQIHVKLLIPSVSAGPLIGKGGETIAQLQREKGISMKLSKANDYYPGTSERVCLIAGDSMDAILSVLDFIMEKVMDSMASKGGSENEMMDRESQMKIIVPNSTAGMIIGKSGSYIKQVTDESGARVQISQRAKDQQEITPERCVTITGDREQLQKASGMVVEKIANDPQSNSFLNVSYSHVTHPVANANPQGSPYAFGTNSSSNSSSGGGGGMQMGSSSMRGGSSDMSPNTNLSQLLNSFIPPGQIHSAMNAGTFPQLIDTLNLVLRNVGFPDTTILEICGAVRTLANHRILGWSFGQGTADNNTSIQSLLNALSNNSFGQEMPMSGANSQNMFSSGSASSGSGGGGGGNASNWSGGDGNMMNMGSGFALPPTSMSMKCDSGNEYNIQTIGGAGGNEEAKFELPVNENIVGAIIGFQGKTLTDIQSLTGTKIQISKKGEYAPGTRDRIVTITGPGSSVISARAMIQQRITTEKMKRQQSGGAGDAPSY